MGTIKPFLTGMLLLQAVHAAGGDAERDAQLQRMERAISRIQQEQQSTYQEFGMVQELRRSLMQQNTPPPPPAVIGVDDLPSYDEQARQHKRVEEQLQRYTVELEGLYARYRELEAQKRSLLDRMRELSQSP